jgi:hypothetical protein
MCSSNSGEGIAVASAALGLFNTKAPRIGRSPRRRLQAANDVLERGTESFFESMIPRLLGKTTRERAPIWLTAYCA